MATGPGVPLRLRHRLDIACRSRNRDEVTRRTVSPQCLMHYRDNECLNDRCHMRDGLRILTVDHLRTPGEGAETPLDHRLTRHCGPGPWDEAARSTT